MVGRTFSHYRILQKLGEGGMGTVYRAEDLLRARPVALKVLRPERVGGGEGRERLRREARACVALHHPNITAVYEVDEVEGEFFIAMELVEGETLRTILGRGPLPWLQLVRIGRQTAGALARAHRQGLVHRDIKPENIMVDREGKAKVLDFGLARDVQPDAGDDVMSRTTRIDGITHAGLVVGTLAYLSPEQAQGRPVGPAADTFSLGVVLYELAAGRLPFHGDNAATWIHAIVYEDPEPLRTFRPETPPGLDAVVRRALRKRADRRYPDGEALEAALGELEASIKEMPPAEAGSGADPRPYPRGGALTVQGRMVGRQAEFDLLREMLRAVAGGHGRATWVAGEAGCGNSRLLQELAAHGERTGALALRASCRVREGTRPYHPFADALWTHLGGRGIRRVSGLAAYLDRIEPGLGRWAAVLASLLPMPETDLEAPINREQILDAVISVLAALSRRQPVLLLFDDLQWADRETLELTQHLLRNLSRTRILLVAAYRPEDLIATDGAVHPLTRLLERADREAPGARIALRRLDREETAELAEEVLGGARLPEAFLDSLHGRTGGNPLFIVELIKMLQAEGVLERTPAGGIRVTTGEEVALPARVRDIIVRRLRHLSPVQRRLLEVAGVEGAVFHSSTLESCLKMSRMEVLGQLQTLERELQLVHAEEEGYRFDHPLIHDVLVEGILPELRREYHRQVGNHLIQAYGSRAEHAAAIAYQLLQARDHVAALPYLMVAAKTARRVFSNEAAIGYLDEAEGILSAEEPAEQHPETEQLRMKVHERRGELLQMLGRYEEAMEDYLRLEERARRSSDVLRLAMASNRLGMVRGLVGDYDGALEAARRARDAARDARDERALAEAGEVEGLVHYHRGDFEAALACHSEAMRRRRDLRDDAGMAHNLNKIGNIRYYQGEYEAALAAYQAALAMERELGDRRGMAESLMNVGATYLQMGDSASALDHHQAALTIKREIGDRRSTAMSLNNLALVHEAMGRLVEARAVHEESLAIKREIGDQRGISTSLSNLASLYERMGYFEQALHAAEESLAIKRTIADRMSMPYALNEIGAVLLDLGQPEEAEARHREALGITREVGDRTEEAQSLRRLGEVALERGDAAGACGPLAESLALAREVGAREGELQALYSLGQAQVQSGRLDSAEATANELETRAEGGSTEYQAKAQRLQGLVAAACSRQEEARGRFQSGQDLAAEVGLRDLQWRLHLDASRVRPGGDEDPEAREDRGRARIILEELVSRLTDPEARARFHRRPGVRSLLGDR